MANGKRIRIEGVWVATTTFFDETGALDLNDLTRHLNWLAGQKVHGFVPCGTTGEGSVLDKEERRQVLKLTQKIGSENGIGLMAGCGSNNTRAVIEYTKEAADLGYGSALVVSPYYNRPTPRGLLLHYEAIANASPIPIVLYNVPGRTSCPIPADTASELLLHPNIIGIKEASGSHAQWMSLARQINLSECSLLAGDDDAFYTMLTLGGSGIISASANVVPQIFVQMYDLYRSGKIPQTLAVQLKVLPLVKAMFMETNPAPAKAALQLLHQSKPFVRLPLAPVTKSTEMELSIVLKALELL